MLGHFSNPFYCVDISGRYCGGYLKFIESVLTYLHLLKQRYCYWELGVWGNISYLHVHNVLTFRIYRAHCNLLALFLGLLVCFFRLFLFFHDSFYNDVVELSVEPVYRRFRTDRQTIFYLEIFVGRVEVFLHECYLNQAVDNLQMIFDMS